MKLIDLVMILVLFGSPVGTILAEGEETAASPTEVRAESEPAVAEESTSSEEPVTAEDEESADETEVTQEKPSGSPQVSEDQALEILEALHEDQDSTIDGVAGNGQEGNPDEARDEFLSLLASDPLEGAAGGEGATASRGFDSLFRNRQLLMGGEVCHDCHDSEKERAGRGGFTLDLLGPSGSSGAFSGERRAELPG